MWNKPGTDPTTARIHTAIHKTATRTATVIIINLINHHESIEDSIED